MNTRPAGTRASVWFSNPLSCKTVGWPRFELGETMKIPRTTVTIKDGIAVTPDAGVDSLKELLEKIYT